MYGRLVKRREGRDGEREEEEKEGSRSLSSWLARSATEQLTNQDCSRETKEREERRGSGRRERTAAVAAVTAARQQLFY